MPGVFEIHGTNDKLSKLWIEWRSCFEIYVTRKKISNHEKKRRLFFQFAGKDVLHYVQVWCNMADNYESLLTSLENSFRSKINIRFERYLFHACVPQKYDYIDCYIDRLGILAKSCCFENETDRIVDQVIEKYASNDLRQTLLRRHNLDLEELLNICRAKQTFSANKYVENAQSKPRKNNSNKGKYKKKQFTNESR